MTVEGRLTDVVITSEHAKAYLFALELIGEGGVVLDVGTGDGSPLNMSLNWAKCKPRSVIASDTNLHIMAELRRKNSVFPLVAKNSLPFGDNTFGLVISSQVIEHIPRNNHLSFVRQLVRVAKPESYVAISTINHDFPYLIKGHKDHIAEYDIEQATALIQNMAEFGKAELMVVIGSDRFLRGQKQRAKYWWLRPIKDIIPKRVFAATLTLLTGGEIRPALDMRNDFWIKPIAEIQPNEIIADFIFLLKKKS